MDSCPASGPQAPATSPGSLGGDSFQPVLAIVAIMAGSLVSLMFLMVLLAILGLVGAAGFMAYRLIKNETNPTPNHTQMPQPQPHHMPLLQQHPQQQYYLPAPPHLNMPHPQQQQQLQQVQQTPQQQYAPASPRAATSPAPSTHPMEGGPDPSLSVARSTISFDKVRETSMAIMEQRRESLTSAQGFYTRAEQNLDRVVDPSKAGMGVQDTSRPSTRPSSTAHKEALIRSSRSGSETATGSVPRTPSDDPPSKPGSTRDGQSEKRKNSISLNENKAFLTAATRSSQQHQPASPAAPLQPARGKRRSSPSPKDSTTSSEPSDQQIVASAPANGNKREKAPPGARASLWDIPNDMIAGLRGSKTNTWERRVEVSHREGFVETLNIAEKLGAGAFGQVFQCQWEGARAAVKLIDLEGSSDINKQNSVETFMAEAEVAALLRHPNIVQVYKVNLENFQTGEKQGFRGAIVMEFCELGSLADAINNDMFTFQHSNSPLLDLQLMLKVAEDVARGMLFLHNQDILHGDLKPNNVLLKQHNDGIGAKLTDFGLSVRMSCSQTHVSQHQTGTLDHMAPEVMMEGKSSKRSDVYAYGILLWEVFCCARPYVGMRDVAIVHKVVEENMRPVFPKDAPREYVELASSCWEKDEQKRPEFSEIVARVEQMNLILMRLLNSDIGDDAGHEETTTTSRPDTTPPVPDTVPPLTEDPFAEEMDGPGL